jgi:hypothetical protein
MQRKKRVKCILIVLLVIVFGLQLQSDDKELFMGLNIADASKVKANVVVLMSSAETMNTIVFYPRKGPDGLLGTADDGYDYNKDYTGGDVEAFTAADHPDYMSINETGWHARWVIPDSSDPEVKHIRQLDQHDLASWPGGIYWTGCYANDGTPNNFRVGSNGVNYFEAGDWVLVRAAGDGYNPAVARVAKKYIGADGQTWFELDNLTGGPIIPSASSSNCYFQKCPDGEEWVPRIVYLYGKRDRQTSDASCPYQPGDTLYPINYLRWMYIHATDEQRTAVNHFSHYATFDTTDVSGQYINGPSKCDKGNLQFTEEYWTRLQVAKEVLCTVAETSSSIVNLGLFKLDGAASNLNCGDISPDTAGAARLEVLGDRSEEVSLSNYRGSVWGIEANGWSPLAEGLADVWYYYKPGPAAKSYWPVDKELADGTISVANSVSDIDYWCQNNYVVLIADGKSSADDFSNDKYVGSMFAAANRTDYPVKRGDGWHWDETNHLYTWDPDGWGDKDNYDLVDGLPDSAMYDAATAIYCPNYSCWDTPNTGTDMLDDMAYFLSHQDMFPDYYFGDDSTTGWPGLQRIFTYVIGFGADNDMLLQTAINGDGAYYTAESYEDLVEAFQNVITSINLRNFAFSAITAPKKTATATNDELTLSYVGYFMPSQAASIWEGHLLAFKLDDAWGFDADGSGDLGPEEFVYNDQEDCLNASSGLECYRSVILSLGQEWDAADRVPDNRSLYTNQGASMLSFELANVMTLKPLFGSVSEPDAEKIIATIRQPRLADVFHADVGFVGPPSFGKQFISNLNPTGTGDELYADFYARTQNRRRVLFTGTNDGILHMFYADQLEAGTEIWGFIPDEVLPSLKTIVVDNQHTYTVDGRLTANDIYYTKPNESADTWSTLLVFGLRRGGNSFYGLDITTPGTQPNMLWKFKDAVHSGQSWGKPIIGRIRVLASAGGSDVVDKWVTIVPGGFAYSNENSSDLQGKAVFVVDATDGSLIWKIAYDPTNGEVDTANGDTEIIDVDTTDPGVHLTKSDLFNFPIPTSLNAVDQDNDGYLDTLYFGNLGGHLFKTDISNPDKELWTTYVLYKTNIITKDSAVITAIDGNLYTVDAKAFEVGDGIRGMTSNATGFVADIANKVLTVVTISGTFQAGETIICRSYDPIYLSPAAAYDSCYQLWVVFGTGDRDRPRTNPGSALFEASPVEHGGGRFIAIKDSGATNMTLTDLTEFTIVGDTLAKSTVTSDKGWYFNFRSDTGEKFFDPEPLILPDMNKIPHIYFNTYTPPVEELVDPKVNPCNVPKEGIMTIYDIAMSSCGSTEEIEMGRETGRIAGGGIYQTKEYVMYTSSSGNVADVPGGEGGNFVAKVKPLPHLGGILFWKERKR